MSTGRIKWFNSHQSHGYIVLFDGTEVYFHSSGLMNIGIAGELSAGMNVSFDLIQTRVGPEAQNVDLMD
jgi:cold shock CspA family protein